MRLIVSELLTRQALVPRVVMIPLVDLMCRQRNLDPRRPMPQPWPLVAAWCGARWTGSPCALNKFDTRAFWLFASMDMRQTQQAPYMYYIQTPSLVVTAVVTFPMAGYSLFAGAAVEVAVGM